MRALLACTLATALLAGCGRDVSGPAATSDEVLVSLEQYGLVAYGLIPGADSKELRGLKALPAAIALSAAQEAAITKLIDDFQAANKADIEKLASLQQQLKDGLAAGKTKAELAPIYREARPISDKLRTATTKLQADIQGVLTQAQKDWLASGSPARCYPTVVAPLSRDQGAAMQALYTAYQAATQADREAVAAGQKAAKEAKVAGKTRAEVQAILDSIKDELERLQAAATKLRADIDAVLTAEQRAAGCFGPKAPTTRTGGTGTKTG